MKDNFWRGLLDKFQNMDTQEFASKATGMAGGAIQVGDAIFGKAQFDKNVKAPSVATDVAGRPIYNQYSFIEANKDFRKDIKGTIGRGILQGASGGLQMGAQTGNPYVMAGATIAGALGGLIGGKKRKKQLLSEAVRREDLSNKAVDRFNTSSINYSQELEADDFRDALLRRRRLA